MNTVNTIMSILLLVFGTAGTGYLWAAELRHQFCGALLYVNSTTDTQKIIANQERLALEHHTELVKLQTKIDELQAKSDEQNSHIVKLVSDGFNSVSGKVDASVGILSAEEKTVLYRKLSDIEIAAKQAKTMNDEHYERKRKIDRMNDFWIVIAMSAALAFCVFARSDDPRLVEVLPQIVAIVATWVVYCLVIRTEAVSVAIACMTLISFSAFSILGVKLWKIHGHSVLKMLSKALEQNDEKKPEVIPRDTTSAVDPVKLQAVAKARQELIDAVHRSAAMSRADALLLHEAEIARGPAPPPYPGAENRMGYTHTRHTGYQPEYPQYQGRGETFTPRGYP